MLTVNRNCANDACDRKIKHYRVDKIIRLSITALAREGKQEFKEFDAAKYTKSLFGMYGGNLKRVALEARNEMAGVLIDRFGKDIVIIPQDEQHFTAYVDVIASRHFLGWIISLGDGVRIVGPEDVVEMMKSETVRLLQQYI